MKVWFRTTAVPGTWGQSFWVLRMISEGRWYAAARGDRGMSRALFGGNTAADGDDEGGDRQLLQAFLRYLLSLHVSMFILSLLLLQHLLLQSPCLMCSSCAQSIATVRSDRASF